MTKMEKTAKMCACGKFHACATDPISIGEDRTELIVEYIRQNFGSGSKGCVISDQNTYAASEGMIRSLGSLCECARLNIKSCHADEFMVEECGRFLEGRRFDYFIAAGAGTIHDITRIIAHKKNAPFISYPTAPSVDGFISTIAPITTKAGMKATIPATAPVALFADLGVLAKAPKKLCAAGAGDVLGKYTALADWRVANLLVGEYICEATAKLEYGVVEKFRNSLARYGEERSESGYSALCADLIEALVDCGRCIQHIGYSRPASGAEHHVAHFFEMNVLLSTDCLHGENVGVGSVLCAGLYHRIARSEKIRFVENYGAEHDLLKKYYGKLYDAIIQENAPNSIGNVAPGSFYGSLGKIREIVSSIPPEQEFVKLLGILGGVKSLSEIGAYNLKCEESEIERLTLKLAPYVRDRLTLLKLTRCLELGHA